MYTQWYPTLCDPMDYRSGGSSVHGISQARILEWVAISYSGGIFLMQGSNPSLLCLLHWQEDSLLLAPSRKSHYLIVTNNGASLVAQTVKKSACNLGDPGLIPGSGRYPGEGNDHPLHCWRPRECLENPMGRGAWQATAHGVTKSDKTERLTLSLSLSIILTYEIYGKI